MWVRVCDFLVIVAIHSTEIIFFWRTTILFIVALFGEKKKKNNNQQCLLIQHTFEFSIATFRSTCIPNTIHGKEATFIADFFYLLNVHVAILNRILCFGWFFDITILLAFTSIQFTLFRHGSNEVRLCSIFSTLFLYNFIGLSCFRFVWLCVSIHRSLRSRLISFFIQHFQLTPFYSIPLNFLY